MFINPLVEKIQKVVKELDEEGTLLPTEFFRIRQETKPRASPPIMYSLAGVVYVATLAVFLALVVTQSQIKIPQSKIVTSDISGSDGWSCSMLSVVSDQIVYNTSDPLLDYSLVKVSELGGACTNDLATASPCDHPLLIIPTVPTDDFPSNIGGVSVSWMGKVVYYQYMTTKYTIDAGTIDVKEDGLTITAVDSDGQGYGLVNLNVLNFDGDTVCALSFTGVGTLLNDNLFNMYVLAKDENILYSVDLESCQLTVLLNGAVTGSLAVSVVYQRDGVVELYYLTYVDPSNACSAYNFLSNINGVTTTYVTNIARATNYCSSLIFFLDSTGRYAYFTTAPSAFGSYDLVADSGFVQTISSDLSTVGWVLLDDSTIYYATSEPAQYFFNIADQAITDMKAIPGGTEVGWFTCGDELLDQLPATPKAASISCASNGLLWLSTFETIFYGTVDAYESKTLATAATACADDTLYERICTTVAHLPPYSCEREIPQPIFTILSTALANSQFFMAVLLMGFAYVMDQLAKRHEAKEGAPAAAAKGDVEMTSAPMHETLGATTEKWN